MSPKTRATIEDLYKVEGKAGMWECLLGAVQQQGDTAGQLDWDLHFVDGPVVRAHQHAAG